MEGLGLKFVFGKPLKGWLRQQGGMMRGWQRRFFVLDSGRLTCLTREDDVLAFRTYVLKDYELKEFPRGADSASFELFSDKGNGDSTVLRAANEEEKKEWVRALRYTIYSDTGGGVFGVPLEELMKYECKEGRSVPYIVEACVKHLELNAKEIEGIFRMPGRTGVVKELRGKFDTGYRPVIDSVDVHTVASLLKSYLRDLPESLIPPSFYQRAMNFALRYSDASSEELQTQELTGLSELLKELPSSNYATLAYICRFLDDLAGSSAKTKMDSRNLSLVFGPNLIRHLDDTPELMMVTSDLTQHLAYMLIHHCQSVFPPVPSQETAQSEAAGNSPVMRRKNYSVATADLLAGSTPLDSRSHTTKSVTRPRALEDLVDVDFSKQQHEVSNTDQPSSSSTSPFVVITSPFEAGSLSTSENRDESTSGETRGGIGCVDVGSGSISGVGVMPVPPRRTKTKSLKRNEHSANSASSPVKSDPSSQLASQDAVTGPVISSAAQNVHEEDRAIDSKGGLSDSGPCTLKDISDDQVKRRPVTTISDSSVNRDSFERVMNRNHSQYQTKASKADLATPLVVDENITVSSDFAKLGPSRTLLEVQVSALKTELVSVKSQSDYQLSALKSQLNEVRSKYEDRITTMGKQHGNKVKDLSARLAAERKARAEAVDQTVSLQAQLYRYKLQYGELQDSK